MTGWALTMTGVPHVFTTHDMGTLTSSSPLWWGGETGVTYANGWLAWPAGTISERAKPLDGDLDVGPMDFTLHDAQLTAGTNLLTSLATKSPENVASTPVASSVTSSATSITVGNGAVFTSPCFAWINREVVRVTAIAGNVLTVTRARLGTKAVAHTVDASQVLYPEAYAACPTTVRRKVCLWRVDGTTATLVWVGYATRAPELSDNGATFTVSCDSMWTVQRANPVGGSALGATRFVGYSDGRERGDSSNPPLLASAITLGSSSPAVQVRVYSNGSYRDFAQLAAHHTNAVNTATYGSSAAQRIALYISRTGSNAFTVDGDSTATWSLRMRWTDRDAVTIDAPLRATSRYSASGIINNVAPTVVMLFTTVAGGTHPVATLAGLPSSWSTTATSEGGATTWETPSLRLVVSDDWSCIFTTLTTSDSGELGPRFTANYIWQPRKASARLAGTVHVLQNPGPLTLVYRVRTEHWAFGLKHSVIALCEDAVSDDWDWSSVYASSNTGPVIRQTAGLRVGRDWVFDGKRTLGDVVTECCQLSGCTPVMRAGRLALHAWGWPDARATASATITRTDIIGSPTWARWHDGLANRVTIRGDALTVDATQAHSRARYGPGRQITIDLAGVDQQTLPVDDPIAFAREVVGRLELWSEPLAAISFKVKASLWTETELGKLLAVSEWMLPNGAGARALSGAKALVVGRSIDLSTATITVEALLFTRRSYPYGPCAKASSVVSATVLQLASGYVGGAYTYSGTTDSTTFTAGDVVELVERDTTTLWTEQLVIASVDTGTNRLTFTASMSATAQSKIGGGWVDVRHADYAACTASQQSSWMFVADDTNAVIDGTAEPQRLIAP